jgi:hypothetical protein
MLVCSAALFSDRSMCDKLYSAPCPANWYAFNGGLSCAAPENYGGACLLVRLCLPVQGFVQTYASRGYARLVGLIGFGKD